MEGEAGETRHAGDTVQAFLSRLAREATDPAVAEAGGIEAEVRVHELTPGLWVAAGPVPARLETAWEVELAKATCPRVLSGTCWKIVAPPHEVAPSAVTVGAQQPARFTRKKV